MLYNLEYAWGLATLYDILRNRIVEASREGLALPMLRLSDDRRVDVTPTSGRDFAVFMTRSDGGVHMRLESLDTLARDYRLYI